MRFAANLSMLFCEAPLIGRLDAAAKAGFDVVEIQFPYEADLPDLLAAKERAGVEMALINIPLGNFDAGDVGLTCVPGREAEYRQAVEKCFDYARALGVRRINSLSGRPPEGRGEEATRTLIDNLRFAADRFAEIDATVLVEPVNPNDVPGFLFNELDPAIEAVEAVDRENVGLLFDFYHMAQTEASLSNAIQRAAEVTAHVQFADTPGRHEPGTGTIDFERALRTLKETGYDGCVSAEYRPIGETAESLGWRKDFEKWTA